MSDPFSIAAGVIAVTQLSQTIGLFVYGLTERPELCRRLASEIACIEGLMSQLQKLEQVLELQPEWQSKVSVLRILLENLRTSLEELDARLKKVSAPKPQAPCGVACTRESDHKISRYPGTMQNEHSGTAAD
jgi:hypothetical protein